MSSVPPETALRLEELFRTTAAAAAAIDGNQRAELEQYRQAIAETVSAVLARLRHFTKDVSGGDPTCAGVTAALSDYVDWLQWTFWDLPHFAVALRVPLDRFRAGVASCGMVYLSMRVFDDVIDRHFSYKGRHPTLLSLMSDGRQSGQDTDGLTVLGGLLLCFEGLSQLIEVADADANARLMEVVLSIRRTIIGAIMEKSSRERWSRDYYDRLVQLKNVEFWRALFAAVDPGGTSTLRRFLERYYALAQKLNDVQDHAEDEARGQPNLVSLHLEEGAVEREIAADYLELGRVLDTLPPREQQLAAAKLHESLTEARQLGVVRCGSTQEEAPRQDARAESALMLAWFSRIDEVIEKMGIEALEAACCAVCGSNQRKYLFEKQGFSFHRCTACTHIYVTPRIRAEASRRISLELDAVDQESPLLEVQKYYAAPICHLLRSRAPGSRLLDIGFGRGYLLQLAQAFGFEVYGIDGSPALVEALRPRFGRGLHLASLEHADLPWGSFDVVVISHVLEHLDDPAALLRKAANAMTPEAVLYVAVPHMDSVQFKVFGKRWDVLSPLVHLQYFTEASLTRLLGDCGFIGVERVQHPELPTEVVPRWIRLIRKLGGNDAGELAMLAAKPPGPDERALGGGTRRQS